MSSVVIIGAGHAGVQAAVSLREMGFEGKIQLIADESHLPYQKPPLSKGYLNGKQTADNLLFRNAHYYEDQKIDLILGEKAVALDTRSQTVSAASGRVFSYDRLILATGAENRRLPQDIAHHALYLRNMTDVQRLRAALETAKSVAVVGGGFIGLEVAAAAVEAGKQVTVLEVQDRLMARVLPAVLSEVFLKRHREMGVNVRLGATVSAEILADYEAVVVGIGVIPNQELAMEAGIECQNGMVVNEFQQTSESNVYAIGDCANHYNRFAGKRCRLESVQNAVDQAKIAAAHICGKAQAYDSVPWFWTNQYDLKLQMAGINTDYDSYVFRGDLSMDKFSVFYFKGADLVAVDSLNRPADHLAARKLLQAGVTLGKDQIVDINFKLTAVLT
ncbi:NAD(P)/FAD-dependent oxidoreductase [Runella slithyformis]|uniref:Ferredoxin--NAD(+) reductase n=1 Tax=Runella slithyformis (strain ATCC 29530 / DSM 19594 / LMG 11500 / NCIMB 11436 / LSU 4) TaxID=761193 RepID=A0A7U4E3X7_RUNSL|nr:FAD-dependent oxidoreductase [Runella slithyformis]AEI46886.1 Ferredoxin--NAD(+) reductase [Runella slithyformis DSM 19594]